MKMGTGIFWGIILVIIGLGIIIKVVFNIDFPFGKIFIAFFFIFIGFKILFGSLPILKDNRGSNHTIFSESKFTRINPDKPDYDIVFGRAVFDLRDVPIDKLPEKLKIATVFGKTVIKINEDIPIKVKVDGIFSSAELPNGNSGVFGNIVYESDDYDTSVNKLFIKTDVVFAGVEIQRD